MGMRVGGRDWRTDMPQPRAGHLASWRWGGEGGGCEVAQQHAPCRVQQQRGGRLRKDEEVGRVSACERVCVEEGHLRP